MSDVKTIEVHNCWALYERTGDGSEAEPEQKMLSFSRPQDWGRWFYHYARVEFDFGDRHYINHCHLWQEFERSIGDAFARIGSVPFMVMMPGMRREECDRSHLKEDDFWQDEWGTQPPFLEEDDDYCDFEQYKL